MTDKPIIFSAPMVRALLDGRKTQTRRVLKPQPSVPHFAHFKDGQTEYTAGPGGKGKMIPFAPGDRLWVREAFIGARGYDEDPPSEWGNKPIWYPADGDADREKWWHLSDRKRSPIHMPRWASRLTLTVTDVRVQRLQEISREDCIAEGTPLPDSAYTMQDGFRTLWNSIHGPEAWDANPWVAAISFTVHRGNIDQMTPTPQDRNSEGTPAPQMPTHIAGFRS